eukprot:3239794-Pleurochrysis_carterae.AAC.1
MHTPHADRENVAEPDAMRKNRSGEAAAIFSRQCAITAADDARPRAFRVRNAHSLPAAHPPTAPSAPYQRACS